jgi:hypothetical protein
MGAESWCGIRFNIIIMGQNPGVESLLGRNNSFSYLHGAESWCGIRFNIIMGQNPGFPRLLQCEKGLGRNNPF